MGFAWSARAAPALKSVSIPSFFAISSGGNGPDAGVRSEGVVVSRHVPAHHCLRIRWSSALVVVLMIGSATRGGAHDGLSALADWGDFGDAAPCQRTLSAAALACGRSAAAVRQACYDAALAGGSCDRAALDATLAAARTRALDAVEAGCNEQQALRLKASGVWDLLADTVRACAALGRVVEPAYAPVRAGGAVRSARGAERACIGAVAGAAAKLGTRAATTWRRTFDAIAGRALDPEHKEALAAKAAARVRRSRAAVGRMLASRCSDAQIAALYAQPADSLLAAAALAGSCFAEGAFQQGAVTCAQSEGAVSAATPCVGGSAAGYPCHNVDLMAFLPLNSIGGGSGNDVWGWTDTLTGREYALMGRSSGMAFVDVTDPGQPVYLGNLPTQTVNSLWRGVKVYADHAFIVSEAAQHGMQIFNLTQLRSVPMPPVTFTETTHYPGFNNCHTLALNEATGFAYCAGTNTCNGGLHIVDVRNPAQPAFAGCVGGDGYTHETQCVVYHGPDAAYAGRELCFSSNTDTLTIIDVTNKSVPVQISRTSYAGLGYTHQGWLTEDHRWFLVDDELDELDFGHNTRTLIWDVRNLDSPDVMASYFGPTTASDHNLYIARGHAFESNYRAGLRVLDLAAVASGVLTEVGYFDIVPGSDAPGFAGAWSNYPFFASGTVLIGGIEQGLFVVRPNLASSSPTATPTLTATATITATAPATATPTMTDTATATGTATSSPTATPIPVVVLDALPAPIAVGAPLTLTGSGFTAGSRLVMFVATAFGVQSVGPLVPSSWTPTALTVDIPLSAPLGRGFVTIMVVNVDQGFVQSNTRHQLLYGNAAHNVPTILTIDGIGLEPATAGVPLALVKTVLPPGGVMTIGGSGFNGARVNLFTPGAVFAGLVPEPGASDTLLRVGVPAAAQVGPGALQVINQPYSGAVVSNAVSVPVGARLAIDDIVQDAAGVHVHGAGFSSASVINLFNRQGSGVVNLGGLNGQGGARIPLTVVSSGELVFAVPTGAAGGPSYLQVVNPPFIAYSSSGSDPDGAFHLSVP